MKNLISKEAEVVDKGISLILIKRVLLYSLGLLFMAFGVSFSIKSNLGISPVNSIPYVLSLVTLIDQGLITTLVFSVYILMQIVLLKKDFKKINFLQIISASAFGYFVSFSNSIFGRIPYPEIYALKLIFLVVSISFIAIGLLFYLSADIVPQPPEGLILAISNKFSLEFSKVKVLFDSSAVLIACLISLIYFKDIRGIREGTIISAILIGKLLGILSKYFKKSIVKFLYS